MTSFLRRLTNRIRYRKFAADLDDELAFHREMKRREIEGVEGVEGKFRVARAMGNELRQRELARDVWVPPSLDSLRQDVRDAIRMIVRRPIFTATAIAALVTGVGAAVTAFALLNALVLRPLPVTQPERLVYLAQPSFSYPIITEVRERSSFLSNSFAWNLDQYEADWSGESELTLVLLASGNMHAMLGVRPALGRLLTESDETASSATENPGVLSYGAWQRRFGGDPGVVGRTVRVHGVPITIVGVTPREFFGVAPGRAPEITVPLTTVLRLNPSESDRLTHTGYAWLHFMGRLRDGISLEQAEAQFQVIWPQVLEATTSRDAPPDRRARFLARRSSLVRGVTGFSSVRNQFAQPATILMALAALLLLVGCATVANMLLAGAWGRSRELAIRLALGCSRARLARQLLIEGLALAIVAALAAMLLCQWLGEGLVALLNTTLDPVMLDLSIDWRVAVFAGGLVIVTALLFSAAPVMMAMRVAPGPALKIGSRHVSAQGGRLGRGLVAVQMAVAVILLVGASLLLRSLAHLLMLDPGFDGRRVLVMRVNPEAARPILDALARTPAVESATVSRYPPVSDEDGAWTQSVSIDGAEPVEQESTTYFNAVSPGYFATLGIPVVGGRDFAWSDADGTERVVIINRALATRLFHSENPLGREVTIGRDASRANLTVIGVVGDAKYQRLQEATRGIAYVPFAQTAVDDELFASVRVVDLSEGVRRGLRDAIVEASPGASPRIERVADRVRESLVTERLLATLGAALAVCAVFLASASLFGLMAHIVSRQTREIGIRMALGARHTMVMARVLVDVLVLWGIGAGVGMAAAMALGGRLAGTLHGITPRDPLAYGAVGLLTLALAIIAGFIPARRAASINPIEALRAE